MKIVRIVHTADLHLGSFFGSTPEIADRRAAEQLDTLRAITNLVLEREADALLICGDLFDAPQAPPQLLREVQDILGECPVDIFITPGNHDPATPDSCYFDENWPDNVHIFTGELEKLELSGKGAYIWGCGFRRSAEENSILPDFAAPDESSINILMMHAELVSGEDSQSRYNPITIERINSLGMDYVALGHAHTASLTRSGDLVCCIPGCPSGRGFDELGDKGAYAGHVGKRFAHVEFVPLGARRYRTGRINVSGCSVVSEFCAKIFSSLERLLGNDYSDDIFDITLTGALPRGVMPDTAAITRQLMERLHYARVSDMTTTELDISTLMNDHSLRGAFVRTVLGKIDKDEPGRDQYLRALLYGLRAFDGEVRINEDN